MKTFTWLLLAAYTFMLGTAYGTGTPYTRCPQLKDTNFYIFLSNYAGK